MVLELENIVEEVMSFKTFKSALNTIHHLRRRFRLDLSSLGQVLGSVRPTKATRLRQRLLLMTAKKLLVALELIIRRATTTLSWKCVVISHAIANGMKKVDLRQRSV